METRGQWGATLGGQAVLGGKFLPVLLSSEQDVARAPAGGPYDGIGYEYDANGNLDLVKLVPSTTSIIDLRYGDAGNPGKLTSLVDPRGNTTTYSYDGKGNLTTVDPPNNTTGTLLGPTTLSYSASPADTALSRLSSRTDGKGQRTSFAYDTLDRVTTQAFYTSAGALESDTVFVYDPDGNLTERRDRDSRGRTTTLTTYQYDQLNRVMHVSFPGNDTFDYGYDAASNLTSLVDAGGTTSYTYKPNNRVASVVEPGGAQYHVDYTYDDNRADGGRTVRRSYPAGVSVLDTYDAAGRFRSSEATRSGATIRRYDWQYKDSTTGRPNFLLSKEFLNSSSTPAWTYSYDRLDRVTASNYRDAVFSQTFSYDGSNLNEVNQLKNSSYDAAGNRLAAGYGGGSLTYNARNQLVRRDLTSYSDTYQYLGVGQEELWKLNATTFGNSVLGVTWYRGNGDSGYYTHDDQGRPVSERTTATVGPRHYYMLDALGSNRAVFDSETGALVSWFDYQPYGEPVSNGSLGSDPQSFGFAGAWGAEAYGGIIPWHYGARWLDPDSGRSSQQDPIRHDADLQQWDLYLYAAGNPVNRADPSGKTIWDDVSDWWDLNGEDMTRGTRKLIDLPERLEWAWSCGRSLGGWRYGNQCDPAEFLGLDVEDAY